VSAKPNRLIHEKSRTCFSTRYNPVDWYPWGRKRLKRRAPKDKPILISIGYSTCHWCHVMEHESYENPRHGRADESVSREYQVDREKNVRCRQNLYDRCLGDDRFRAAGR